MPMAIRQLQKHFVGEVSGLDLRQPLTKEQAREVEAGMDKYAVLIFHGQDITDEQQLAFALNFGEREKARGGTVVKKEDYRLTSGLNDVSNLGKDGKRLARLSRLHRRGKGDVSAGAAAPGAHAPCASPQIAVSLLACRRHQGHERAGGPPAAARPQRARHAERIRLRPQMDAA